MQPLPHVYSVTGAAGAAGDVTLKADGVPPLTSAAPLQFDGRGDQWSPESLLVAAVASCFVLTFRSVARASKLQWTRLECGVEATLERPEGVMQFTRMAMRVALTVPESTSTLVCERALTKAEHDCLVANSLRCRRELQMKIDRIPVAEPRGGPAEPKESLTEMS